MNKQEKQEIINKFGANQNDTGSASVQIALLSKRIAEITEHLKVNKKDNHTKRGLLKLLGQRKGLLKYLEGKDLEGYRALKKELGIR